MLSCLHPVWKNPIILTSSASPFSHNLGIPKQQLNYGKGTKLYSKRSRIVCGFLPVDPWAPNVDSQSIASQLFAFSLFPYVGFLYFITKSKTAPKLTLFGFYFLLAFVGATICNCYQANPIIENTTKQLNCGESRKLYSKRSRLCVDFAWAPNDDSQSIASQLFAFSLFPYVGFLYFITKSKTAPKLTIFGFYFLPAFMGATIPAGIYAKVHYGTSLSNVDWLHGGAESLLTLTNLFIVLGLREAIRKAENPEESKTNDVSRIKEEKKSSF